MHKLRGFHLLAAALAFAALVGAEARSAELEGALQYPPSSVGQDAQPPPPAKTVRQLVTPRRIELGVRAARHTTISDAPADFGTWSTAVDRKRTLVAHYRPTTADSGVLCDFPHRPYPVRTGKRGGRSEPSIGLIIGVCAARVRPPRSRLQQQLADNRPTLKELVGASSLGERQAIVNQRANSSSGEMG